MSYISPPRHTHRHIIIMSSSDLEYEEESVPEAEPGVIEPRLTGVVKWFNNKSGFGFITVCQESHPLHMKDVFCYYKSLRVVNFQFRYLVQGEYVDFTLVKAAVEPHEYQAVDVTGVQSGPLMCETRSTQANMLASSMPPTYRSSSAPHRSAPAPHRSVSGSSSLHANAPEFVPKRQAPPPLKHRQTKGPKTTDADGFTQVDRRRSNKPPLRSREATSQVGSDYVASGQGRTI
jgi:cold shock CspA family protein